MKPDSDIAPRLEVRMAHQQGGFRLEVAFTAPGRGVTALFGPSGAGKTSVLRAVSGLMRPKDGHVAVGGQVWLDSTRKIFLAPHRRRVGYVFQEASLFPHLTVSANLKYAQLRARTSDAAPGWDAVVEWLGLMPLLLRMPQHLSGGERQRVAIGRALLSNPAVLLLDEPLSALDEASREEIFACLEAMQQRLNIPMLYVSHRVREVARLAKHVVFLREGRVTHAGPAGEALREMVSTDAGEKAPFALVEAEILAHDHAHHLSEAHCAFGTVWLPGLRHGAGARVWLQVYAREVSIALRQEPGSSLLNQWPCRITGATAAGAGQMLLRLAPGQSESGEHLLAAITLKSWEALSLRKGDAVHARVKSVSMIE